MRGSTGERTGPDRALAVHVVLAGPAPCPRASRDDEPLRGTVMAADDGQRRRLVSVLAGRQGDHLGVPC